MAITAKNASEVKESIAANKAKGFTPSTFEIALPEDTYNGIATGLYKDIPYTNTSGKGLLIMACATVELNGVSTAIDIPIAESKVGMWNEGEPLSFEVFRKNGLATEPKRVKLATTETSVNVGEKQVVETV